MDPRRIQVLITGTLQAATREFYVSRFQSVFRISDILLGKERQDELFQIELVQMGVQA
jgi:hypothetical protein